MTYTFDVILIKVNDSHNHNTRNNTLTFKVRYTRTSIKKKHSVSVSKVLK